MSPFPLRPQRVWRFRLAACALACLALWQPKARAEWVVATRNPAGDAVTSYDTGRARLTEHMLEVWTRAQGAGHKNAMVEDYRRRGLSPSQVQSFEERFASRLIKWRVDCDKRLARALALADYDAAGEAFLVIETPAEEGVIWPESAVDAAAERLCARPAKRQPATSRSAPPRDRESRPR